MTRRERICRQLDALDDELLGAVERVVDAFVIVIKLRQQDLPTDSDGDGDGVPHEEFDLESALDPNVFHDQDASPDDVGTIVHVKKFTCGDEVEVILPDPIGLRLGVFVAVEPSGQYRINLGGGISKAFPPDAVRRRLRPT